MERGHLERRDCAAAFEAKTRRKIPLPTKNESNLNPISELLPRRRRTNQSADKSFPMKKISLLSDLSSSRFVERQSRRSLRHIDQTPSLTLTPFLSLSHSLPLSDSQGMEQMGRAAKREKQYRISPRMAARDKRWATKESRGKQQTRDVDMLQRKHTRKHCAAQQRWRTADGKRHSRECARAQDMQ